MITTVGEAQIVVRANTAGVKAELASTDLSAGGALASKADTAGADAGAALSSGFGKGAKDIGKDAVKSAETETGKIKGLWNDIGQKASGSLSSLGVPASLLSGPKVAALGIAAIGAASVKLAIDMQTANASIATSENITVKAATNVGNAFLNTAGKAEYSGIKQAQAFSQVAGELKSIQGQALTTAQSTTFMNNAMDLAAASGNDLTTSTQTLAGVMQAFQVPVSQAAGAAQTLFNASRATGIGIDTLAASVERVKGRLGTLAPPLKDLSALMVDLTHNGITGRGALTALQGSYTALAGAATGTTKTNITARDTLKEYGIQVVNAKGQITPMSTIIEKLGPKFKTMTQQQQLATATLIFGASAAKQMTAVLDAGTNSYNKATTAVNQNNTVTKASAIEQQTLQGKMAILGAAVSDDGTKLGSVLVPALTKVAGAILPVINGLVDVVGWFAKGSTEAHAVEAVIATILAPALIKMGATAVAQAARSVIAFVTMSGGATTMADKVAVQTGLADTSIATIGTTTAETAGVVGTETKAMGASFLSLLNPISIAVAAAILGRKQIVGAINDISNSVFGTVNNSAQFQQKYDAQAALDKNSPSKLSALNKFDTKAAKLFGFSFTPDSKTSLDTNTKAVSALSASYAAAYKHSVATHGTAQYQRQVDAYIAPPNTVAIKAAAAAAKKAASASASAAKKSAADAVKAQTTLTSEVVTAIKMPFAKGVEQLKALGVPANKATQALHDAVKPFTDSVKALEKAGFTAAESVKIADAGQAELQKEAKAAAAKAKAAVKAATTATTGSLTALMVNGIAVSGSVYRAAIGAAYKTQTGANLNGTNASTPIGFMSAPVAPTPTRSLSRGVVLNIASGAINIHPAPGNDAASLNATKTYIDQALRQLAAELRGGTSGLAVVR